MEKFGCSKRLFGAGATFRGRMCKNAATVERDGKHYCATHDPVRKGEKDKARAAARDAERQAEYVAHEKAKARRIRNDALAELAPDLMQALVDMIELRDASMRSELHPKGEVAIVLNARATADRYRGLAP